METPWTTVIQPRDRFFDFDLKAVWDKRYLLWLFVKRDITVQFKQTVFGLSWYVISPLISTFVYIVIFSRVAGIPTDGIPQPLFYLSGVCLWNYFAQCLTKVAATFQENAGIFGKVYFPRLIAPLSVLFSKLLRFGIQILLFAAVYVIYVCLGCELKPNWYLLLFPVLVLMLGGIGFGLGLVVTSLTTKYRDLRNFFGFFVGLWMYATPIVYPLSVVKNPTLYKVMLLNPITSIIETFKYGTMGAGSFSWEALGLSFGVMVVLIFLGILMFNRKQKGFIDTI